MEIFQGGGSQPTDETVKRVVYSTENEQKVLTLSDGSRIRLNKNSSLEMAENFESNERAVSLDGEAFFEITHNPDRPFKVHTGSAAIRVLGTSFSVKTNTRQNDVFVSVADGSVSLASMKVGSESEVLEKGFLGILKAETQEITLEKTDINNYMSWMNGRIIFDQTPFAQVAKQLERIYNIECTIKDNALLDMKLTTNFSELSLDNVLKVIAEGLEIEYEQKEDTVTWALI
ncbi:MAG: FecR domain-containing protein [Balneolales bacterium]